MKKLRALNHRVAVKDKVVLVRIDADVPVVKGEIDEGPNGRLHRAAVGIEWLRQRGAKVVVIAHRGRPKGKRVAALSLAPMVKRLESLLTGSVKLSKEITGPRVKKRIANMEPGDVLVLENIRFLPGERKNDLELAKKLAQLGDLYVNDAFATSHRPHASVTALAKELPAYAGLELQHELDVLSKVLKRARKSLVVVLGGRKIHTKIETLEAFLRSGARVCVGGALAIPFYEADGCSVGTSEYDKKDLPLAKRLLKKYREQIVLPEDVVTVRAIRRRAPQRIDACEQVEDKGKIVDIGPGAVKRFGAEMSQAKTVVWNGPLGIVETPDFAKGTHAVVKKMAKLTGSAMTVVGGGDTVPVVDRLSLHHSFTLVSTGGGAMMAFLAGESLPGLEALML